MNRRKIMPLLLGISLAANCMPFSAQGSQVRDMQPVTQEETQIVQTTVPEQSAAVQAVTTTTVPIYSGTETCPNCHKTNSAGYFHQSIYINDPNEAYCPMCGCHWVVDAISAEQTTVAENYELPTTTALIICEDYRCVECGNIVPLSYGYLDNDGAFHCRGCAQWLSLEEDGLLGDANADNKVSIADAVILSRYVNEETVSVDTLRADINHDKNVNMDDVTMILRKIARLPLNPQAESKSKDLMSGFEGSSHDITAFSDDFCDGQNEFALRLVKTAATDASNNQNILISPASVVFALGMTANGTAEDTRTAWENGLCGISVEELNRQLWLYRKILSGNEVNVANAIWFRDNLVEPPRDSFLQVNADYYGAGAFSAPFDQSTCDDINAFVKTNTKDMIPEILDEIPQDPLPVMYLVNALAMEKNWLNAFQENTQSGSFRLADGTDTDVEYMVGEADHYCHFKQAHGVLKQYEGEKLAFAAFLPTDATMSPVEYLETLDGKTLTSMINSLYRSDEDCELVMPQFTLDFKTDIAKQFDALGIPTSGNFTNMYENEMVRVTRVLHKTHIEVSPVGTKAAAATVVEMCKNAAAAMPVELIRPFVYMIVDNESHTPLFIGTMDNPPKPES